MTTCVDRTEEFHRCVELFSEGKIIPKRIKGQSKPKGLMLDAENLYKQIHFIETQLNKLAKLVHKGGMFDNTTKEVNDLTALCKAQLERCNLDLKLLQQHGTNNVNETTAQHFKILVDSLRRRLSKHGKKFKEILESRSATLKRQHKRRQKFASNDIAIAAPAPTPIIQNRMSNNNRPQRQVNNMYTSNNNDYSNSVSAPAGGGLRQRASIRQNQNSFTNVPLHNNNDSKSNIVGNNAPNPYRSSSNHNNNTSRRVPHHNPYASGNNLNSMPANPYLSQNNNNNNYQQNNHSSIGVANYQPAYQSDFQTQQYYFKNDTSQRKSEAVQAAKTISTISSMWSQMTNLIAQQDDMLPSIEDNIFQAEVHVNKGQTELLKYWQTISGERALILKLFAVLLFIIFIFTYMRS
jgi:syntaxin 5